MSNWEIKFAKKSFTLDDALPILAENHVLPNDVGMSVQLTKDIKLNIPLMSANMDIITDSNMAIAMARQGGLGVVHKSMTIAQQTDEVHKVKRSESGVIIGPFFPIPTGLVTDTEELVSRHHISGVPIVETMENCKLAGIITNRDMRFITSYQIKIEEVMTKDHLVTAPVSTPLKDAERVLQKHKIERLPIINKAGRLNDLITIKDIEEVVGFPSAARDEHGRLLVAAAVGAISDTPEYTEALLEAGTDVIVIDTAYGHSAGVTHKIKKIRETFLEATLIAGNAATAEATKALYDIGVDVAKVGIGPGSICITRVIADVGAPRLITAYDATSVAREHGKAIIADGGIKYSGDIMRTLAAGGHTIILGSMLAGTDKSPDEFRIYQGCRSKTYRGMGSLSAMGKGSNDHYFQGSINGANKLISEGIEGRITYKGSVSDIVFQLIDGLKLGTGYVGAADLKVLREGTQFVQMSGNGLRGSHPHDTQTTKGAPNCPVQ